MIGLVSGGCLEGDLLEHAKRVLETGVAILVHYDASTEDDIVWGLGLGCAGVVEVWLERVDHDTAGPLDELARWINTRQPAALATAIEGPRFGQRRALPLGDVANGSLASDAIDSALAAALDRARGQTLELSDERISIEYFRPPTRIVLFGAGPDAAPLARLAGDLGWDADLYDPRRAVARAERFPGATVVCTPIEGAVAHADPGPDSYCVVMTHHYLNDRALLKDLLATPTAYIAMLGPKQRTEDLLSDLASEGLALDDGDRERIFAPAGLDLGADAPETIALSIAAEIQAVSSARSGGWLRDRKGPIHDPETA
jgi:xanthine/CO dehydrogenase XdhC/CoxF family maturation factor